MIRQGSAVSEFKALIRLVHVTSRSLAISAIRASSGFFENDRKLVHLLRLLSGRFTDVVRRVWRTQLAPLIHLGLLWRENIDGRHTRWISPVSLFLANGLVYFRTPVHGGHLTLRFS
jgi:hypothetical protein